MQGTRLLFNSQDDATHFAEKQGAPRFSLSLGAPRQDAEGPIGWDYYVQSPTVKRIPPKNYGENYAYKPHTLRIARTK
jgi:NADH dehydrogenase (ubiquinone) Fe-S protein 4